MSSFCEATTVSLITNNYVRNNCILHDKVYNNVPYVVVQLIEEYVLEICDKWDIDLSHAKLSIDNETNRIVVRCVPTGPWLNAFGSHVVSRSGCNFKHWKIKIKDNASSSYANCSIGIIENSMCKSAGKTNERFYFSEGKGFAMNGVSGNIYCKDQNIYGALYAKSFAAESVIEVILDMTDEQPLLKYIVNGTDFGFIPTEKITAFVIDPNKEYRLAISLFRPLTAQIIP